MQHGCEGKSENELLGCFEKGRKDESNWNRMVSFLNDQSHKSRDR